MIKLIIFDLDDTLYKENSYVKSGFSEVSKYISKKTKIPQKKIFTYIRGTFKRWWRGNNFDKVIEHFNIKNISKEEMIEIYRKHIPKIKISDKNIKLLKLLKKKYLLCIITNGNPWVQRNKTNALDVEKYVDKIYYAEDEWFNYRKPHKRFFQKAMKEFWTKPKETIMIGDDITTDIAGAKSIGIETLHINIKTIASEIRRKIIQ